MQNLVKYILIFTTVFSLETNAQQTAVFNHYFINSYLINPARAGQGESTNAYFIYRQQWAGITGAPVSQVITLDGPVKKNKIGLGLTMSNDVTNIIGKTGVWGTYSYRLKINDNNDLTFGVSGGMLQQRILFDKVRADNANDQSIFNTFENKTVFDANAGIVYRYKKLQGGLASYQLTNNKIIYENQTDFKYFEWRNVRHYTATVQYSFDLKKDKLTLDPIVLIRSAAGLPFQFEVNTLFKFKQNYWANLSYRHGYGVGMAMGALVYERFRVGYNYEYPINKLKGFSNGSHEIMLGFKFIKRSAPANELSQSDGKQMDAATMEQYDQVIQRLDVMADDIKRSNEEREKLKEENRRLSSEMESLRNETAKDKKDFEAVKKGEQVKDIEKENFDTKLNDYYVVVGAFRTLNTTKLFQKIMQRDCKIETSVIQNASKSFYYIYTKHIGNKSEALTEIERVNKIDTKDNISGNVWLYKVKK